MKLSIVLILSLVGYSSLHAARDERNQFYPPPGVPKPIYDQQDKELQYWKHMQMIHKLRAHQRKLDQQIQECKNVLLSAFREFQKDWDPRQEKDRKAAWADFSRFSHCMRMVETKDKVDKDIYEVEHQR